MERPDRFYRFWCGVGIGICVALGMLALALPMVSAAFGSQLADGAIQTGLLQGILAVLFAQLLLASTRD